MILLVCVIVVLVMRTDRDLDFLATYLKGTPTNVIMEILRFCI